MKVELIRAWPRRFERLELDLAECACVADALDAAGIEIPFPQRKVYVQVEDSTPDRRLKAAGAAGA